MNLSNLIAYCKPYVTVNKMAFGGTYVELIMKSKD